MYLDLCGKGRVLAESERVFEAHLGQSEMRDKTTTSVGESLRSRTLGSKWLVGVIFAEQSSCSAVRRRR